MSPQDEGLLSCFQHVLLINIPASINSAKLIELQARLLLRLETSADIIAVVLNFQQVRVAESSLFHELDKLLHAIKVMGIPTALAGMQAGLVSALVHLEVNPHEKALCFKHAETAIRQLRHDSLTH